jgi:recombination protein RecA
VGKTYLTYRLIASAQQRGLRCAYVDAERTFAAKFAQSAGVDLDALVYYEQTESGNRVIDFMETLLRGEEYSVIILDSIAALLPMEEADEPIEKTSMDTRQAKLMSKALRKLTVANRGTALVYINQLRDSLGGVFAKRSVTSGGRAMGFYAATRIEMVRTENIKKKVKVVDPKKGKTEQDVVKGHRVLVHVEKDKTGGPPQGTKSSFIFDYDRAGIDPIEDLIYIGQVFDLVHRKGNKFWVEGYEEDSQQYQARFSKWLRANKAVAEELEEQLVELINAGK